MPISLSWLAANDPGVCSRAKHREARANSRGDVLSDPFAVCARAKHRGGRVNSRREVLSDPLCHV